MNIRKFFNSGRQQGEGPGAREVDIGIDLQTLLSEFGGVLLDEGPRKAGQALARGDLVPAIEMFADKFGDYICDVFKDLDTFDPADYEEGLKFYGLVFRDPADAGAWIEKLHAALKSVIAARGYDCSADKPVELPESEN